MITGHAPVRTALQNPYACPSFQPPGRFVSPALTRTLRPAPALAPVPAAASDRILLALRFSGRSTTTPTTRYPVGTPAFALPPNTPPRPAAQMLLLHSAIVSAFDAGSALIMTIHASRRIQAAPDRWLHILQLNARPLPDSDAAELLPPVLRSSPNFSIYPPSTPHGLL
jgi:hypothetical protein